MANQAREHYFKAWKLSDPRLLAKTPTSHVYVVKYKGEDAVLKLLTLLGKADEKHGAAALRHFGGHGAVHLLHHDEQAHLLEYLDGEDLTSLVRKGEDERATAVIANVLNKLHRPFQHPPPVEWTLLRTRFRALFEKAKQDTPSIYARAAYVAELLLSDPREVCVLHGDIHHENIRYSMKRGWLAIDPKGLFGERTYDAANTLCNPLDMPALVENESRLMHNAEILAQRLGVERLRLLNFVFAYACLSASWSLEDGQEPSHALKIAEIAEPYTR